MQLAGAWVDLTQSKLVFAFLQTVYDKITVTDNAGDVRFVFQEGPVCASPVALDREQQPSNPASPTEAGARKREMRGRTRVGRLVSPFQPSESELASDTSLSPLHVGPGMPPSASRATSSTMSRRPRPQGSQLAVLPPAESPALAKVTVSGVALPTLGASTHHAPPAVNIGNPQGYKMLFRRPDGKLNEVPAGFEVGLVRTVKLKPKPRPVLIHPTVDAIDALMDAKLLSGGARAEGGGGGKAEDLNPSTGDLKMVDDALETLQMMSSAFKSSRQSTSSTSVTSAGPGRPRLSVSSVNGSSGRASLSSKRLSDAGFAAATSTSSVLGSGSKAAGGVPMAPSKSPVGAVTPSPSPSEAASRLSKQQKAGGKKETLKARGGNLPLDLPKFDLKSITPSALDSADFEHDDVVMLVKPKALSAAGSVSLLHV